MSSENTPGPDKIPSPPKKWLGDLYYDDQSMMQSTMFDIDNNNNKHSYLKDKTFNFAFTDSWSNYSNNNNRMYVGDYSSEPLNEIQIPEFANSRNDMEKRPLFNDYEPLWSSGFDRSQIWSTEFDKTFSSKPEKKIIQKEEKPCWSTIVSRKPIIEQQNNGNLTSPNQEVVSRIRMNREEIRKLDIYMPKTVWLMIRIGLKKTNKISVQRLINQMCSNYSLLPEEFYQFYPDLKKADNIVLQLSNKNYEKLNSACPSTDPKFTINDQQYAFRRVSPIVQCFLCFGFDHYNSNCTLGYKRCEYCSDKYTHGHECECDNFCINCKNANYKLLDHSPKSLNCPLVFEKCQQIAERMIAL